MSRKQEEVRKRRYGKRMKSAKLVSFKMEDELVEHLREWAETDGVTVGEKLRRLLTPPLRESLDNEKRKERERGMPPLELRPVVSEEKRVIGARRGVQMAFESARSR